MRRVKFLVAAFLQLSLSQMVSSAQQQVQLSDSYLPVAMQVIAHLTDQMAFENKDETTTTKKPITQKPVNDWQKPQKPSTNPWPKPTTTSWQKPTSKPTVKPPYTWPPYAPTQTNSWSSWTTSKPYVSLGDGGFYLPASGKPPAYGKPPAFVKPPTFGKPPAFSTSWNKPSSSSSYLAISDNGPFSLATFPPHNSPASGNFPYVSGFGLNSPSGQPPVLGMQPSSGWWMNYGLAVRDSTTPFHRPGFYAPAPPKPHERFRVMPKSGYLLPYDDSQYTVIGPQETRSDTLLDVQEEDEVQPLIEPAKDTQLLPHFEEEENEKSPRASDEINEENLQYLSESVQQMIRMANDPDDDRVVDVWDGLRGAHNQEILPKGKLSASNLRLLLLYDLLSREAKRLRLSDYSGFSPDVLRRMSESSSGGARQQLAFALSRMVERKDCEHEYANNRAKEMVQELAKDESKLSSEIRYLQPLIYKF